MKLIAISFTNIANSVGFYSGPDGKINIPAEQEVADMLASAACTLVPEWTPGDEPIKVFLIVDGDGYAVPEFALLAIAGALFCRAETLYCVVGDKTVITVFQRREKRFS